MLIKAKALKGYSLKSLDGDIGSANEFLFDDRYWACLLYTSKRGAFYETAGCLRDVIQNHLFQVVALLAMEPPAGRDFGAVHSEKAKVFKAMRPLTPDDMARGQYAGYRDEQDVAKHSDCLLYTSCVVPNGKNYCSEACADKKKTPELTCQCKHPECIGDIGLKM